MNKEQEERQLQDLDPLEDDTEADFPDTDADFGGDADVPIPGSPPPLSPGRSADREAGIDELPGNDRQTPRDSGAAPSNRNAIDMDIDNAEMDDPPNPR